MTAQGFGTFKQRALDRAAPLSVHLELTYACNWRCVFCYNPRHFDHQPLSLEEWRLVLDDLRVLGTLTVTLTGGEPCAHPKFFDVASAVRERAFALKVYTNAALIDRKAAERFARLQPLAVEVSLHGATAATHDRTTARPGSFAGLWRGVRALVAAGVRVVVKTPLTSLNEHELDAMLALVQAKNLSHRVDARLTARDDGDRGPLRYSASEEALARLMARLKAADRLPEARRQAGGANCGLGTLTLAVDPEGNVYPCVQWRQGALGNVRETPLRELWRGSSARVQAADVARAANQVALDRGGAAARFPFCPALAFQHSGDPLHLDAPFLAHADAAERVRAVDQNG